MKRDHYDVYTQFQTTSCYNCDKSGATFDCNGLKFCDWNCFTEWDDEELESIDELAKELK